MDITALAATTVAVLIPYLAKVGEDAAKEVGKAAEIALSELYDHLKKRFQKKPAAEEALKDLEAKPNDADAQAALRQQIKKLIESDPEFGKELQKRLETLKQDPQTATFLTQVYGGEVGKIINIGEAREVRID